MNRVMVVEDMAIFREPIVAALQKEGFEVFSAANGKQALIELEVHSPDLILLDISMPEMDGLTFLQILREDSTRQGIPVILLTAVNEKDSVLRARSLGVTEYLVKSYFSLNELLGYVKRHINNNEQQTTNKVESKEVEKVAAVKKAEITQETTVESLGVKLKEDEQGSVKLNRETTLTRIRNQTILKTLSGIVREVIAFASSLNCNRLELTSLISQDPVLTSKVLQLANSAVYISANGKTTDIDDAVTRLGFERVRDVATTVGVFDSLAGDTDYKFSVLRCAEHCFSVAMIMNWMSYYNMKDKAFGYTVGLCHDLPDLALRQIFPVQYSTSLELAVRTGKSFEKTIGTHLGISYDNIVVELLSNLGLPEVIIEPIVEYFQLSHGDISIDSVSELARGLALANIYSHGYCFAPSPEAKIKPISKDDYRKVFGNFSVSAINVNEFVSSVRSTVALLSGLSATKLKSISRPLFDKKDINVWYVRHESFTPFDPLEIALKFLANIQFQRHLPTDAAQLEDYSGMVITIPKLGAKSRVFHEIMNLMNSLKGRTLPVLYIVEEMEDDLPRLPENIDVMVYPISLRRLKEFITAVECCCVSKLHGEK